MLVVSPHLDDAVLSCGRWLAAHPGTLVVTVFAGVPSNGNRLTDWDARCGFSNPTARGIAQARNNLWIAWMRLPGASAWTASKEILHEARRCGVLRPALRQALRGLPWALRRRSVLPRDVHEMYRRFCEPRR
jgi:hypothetical protein